MSTYVSNRNNGETDEQGHYRFQTKMFNGHVLRGLGAKPNSPLARNVLIPAGDIRIPYGEYAYTGWNDADVTVALNTADTTNGRIDRIIAYIDRSVADPSGTNNPALLVFTAVAGTPSGTPTKASDGTVNSAVGASNPWVEIATVLVDANATTIAASKITDTRRFVAPKEHPGIIKDYAGSVAPDGFLLCYGQSLLRTDYPELFAVIGTTFGSADSTHFNVPDHRGRVAAGKDNMGGSSANRLTDVGAAGVDGDVLGDVGGAETHALALGELAAHRHFIVALTTGVANLTASNQAAASRGNAGEYNYGMDNGGTATDSNAGRTSETGSGTAHNNVQPTIVMNKIISY